MDVERINKVWRRIANDPAAFHMNYWGFRAPACGTVMCLAGHTCEEFGRPLVWLSRESSHGEPQLVAMAVYNPRTDDHDDIELTAAELLGLDERDAAWLFHCTEVGNDLGLLRDRLEELAVIYGVELDLPLPV